MCKEATRISRNVDKIARIKQINSDMALRPPLLSQTIPLNAATLLPPLAVPACIATLRSMNDVRLTVSQGEADVMLAAIARTEVAPVLSKDSDFYIHNMESENGDSLMGYIPLDSIKMHGDILHGQLYRHKPVAESLGVTQSLLPVLAAFVGCDYLSLDDHAISAKLDFLNSKGHTRIKQVAKSIRAFNHIQDPFEVVDKLTSDLASSRATDALREALKSAVKQFGSVHVETPLSGTIPELLAAGSYSHQLLETATQRIFWCVPFLEDISRGTAWEVSRSIRKWLYAVIAWSSMPPKAAVPNGWGPLPIDTMLWRDYVCGQLVIREHLRRGERLACENVHPVNFAEFSALIREVVSNESDTTLRDFSQLSDSHRETIYLRALHSDTAKVRSLPHHVLPLALALRTMIRELSLRDQAMANHELVAALCAGVRSLSLLQSGQVPGPRLGGGTYRHTRLSLHRLAQLESVVFCSLLLAQSLLHYGAVNSETNDFMTAFWGCLDGAEFSGCMELAKGGASAERILAMDANGDEAQEMIRLYETAYEAIIDGVEGQVDTVLDYGSAMQGSVKKKKKRSSGKSKSLDKMMRQKSNVFDVLSNGCNF